MTGSDHLIHGLPVYLLKADALVREIVRLGGRKEIEEMLLTRYNTFHNPDVAELERVLAEIRDRLYRVARESGWEV